MGVRSEVVLNMIVKDEAHVIERCLSSVKSAISSWVIVDTGSTDGTQEKIRQCLKGIPGELHERPWVNFAHNRNEALQLARESSYTFPDDFAFLLDADEQFMRDPSLNVNHLAYEDGKFDGLTLMVHYGDLRYRRLALARLDRPWRWEGAVHEVLMLDGAITRHMEGGVHIHVEHDGARAKDPETYMKDVKLLEAEYNSQAPAKSPRTVFYLAQSYRDAGRTAEALSYYRQRADMLDGWDQERWYAQYQVGMLWDDLRVKLEELGKAYAMNPLRAEPLIAQARVARQLKLYHVALMYARHAALLEPPADDALFVDTSIPWMAQDEIAIAAWYCGFMSVGKRAARKALRMRPFDERLQQNLAWYEGGLDQGGMEPAP